MASGKKILRAQIYRSHQRVFVCKVDQIEKGSFDILGNDEEKKDNLIKATARGNLLKEGELVVGDFVQVELNEQPREWVIISLEKRKNEVSRVIIREQSKKVTASNVDILAIVASASKPKYKRGLLERYLVRAFEWGIEPIVIFNKMDEFKEKNFDIRFEEERLQNLGIKFFEVCGIDLNYLPQYLKNGVNELLSYMKNKTVLFQGQSGVGKSHIITSLTKGNVKLKSQQIGKVGKGIHTTTWVEMVEYQDYLFMDAPGIRSFSIEDILPENLIFCYRDVEAVSLKCRFSNCTHKENLQGCAFWGENDPRTDKKWSEKDHKIIISRLESYQDLYEEISNNKAWDNNFLDN